MSNIDKLWLSQKIAAMETARDEIPFGLDEDDSNTLAALRIALASLEAQPMESLHSKSVFNINHESSLIKHIKKVVRDTSSPPAPVSVPDALPENDDEEGNDIDYMEPSEIYALGRTAGWNACRAAMLQGSDGTLTNEGTITATQFKPVADLYGLTSPTGGETSFTFDAVEARDFIDGGWSCQEYVELERFQEAITNHTEDKLAMVDHSGDSNNMVEPVTTAYKLQFEQWLSQQTGTIDVECGCVMTEVFFHWLRIAYEAGNSPVIPSGWVMVPVEPTEDMVSSGIAAHYERSKIQIHDRPAPGPIECAYMAMLAAAPQQEVK